MPNKIKRVERSINKLKRNKPKTYRERAQMARLSRDIGKLKSELEMSQKTNLELQQCIESLSQTTIELQNRLDTIVSIASTESYEQVQSK